MDFWFSGNNRSIKCALKQDELKSMILIFWGIFALCLRTRRSQFRMDPNIEFPVVGNIFSFWVLIRILLKWDHSLLLWEWLSFLRQNLSNVTKLKDNSIFSSQLESPSHTNTRAYRQQYPTALSTTHDLETAVWRFLCYASKSQRLQSD